MSYFNLKDQTTAVATSLAGAHEKAQEFAGLWWGFLGYRALGARRQLERTIAGDDDADEDAA
jgi:hypothetical protein